MNRNRSIARSHERVFHMAALSLTLAGVFLGTGCRKENTAVSTESGLPEKVQLGTVFFDATNTIVATRELYEVYANVDDSRRLDIIELVGLAFADRAHKTTINMDKTFGVQFNKSIDLVTDAYENASIDKDQTITFLDEDKAQIDFKEFCGFKFSSLSTIPGSRLVCSVIGSKMVDEDDESCLFEDKLKALSQRFGEPLFRVHPVNVRPVCKEVVGWMIRDDKNRMFCISMSKTGIQHKRSGKIAIAIYIDFCHEAMGVVDFARAFWNYMALDSQEQIAMVSTDIGSATGALIYDDGDEDTWLYTNAHVVSNASSVVATCLNGKKLKLSSIQLAKDRDLARIRVKDKVSGYLPSRGGFRIGDEITVRGNSAGAGVATKIDGRILGVGPALIEMSAKIVPGNSGSPVFDGCGRIVGIATGAAMSSPDLFKGKEVKEGTRFNKLRYFATRIDNVNWVED